MGLFAFISHSSYADLVEINMKAANATATNGVNETTKDKWNYWIFNIGTDGSYNADQVYKNTQISGNASARRNTEKLKLDFRPTQVTIMQLIPMKTEPDKERML
jgi:hypothetical protein